MGHPRPLLYLFWFLTNETSLFTALWNLFTTLAPGLKLRQFLFSFKKFRFKIGDRKLLLSQLKFWRSLTKLNWAPSFLEATKTEKSVLSRFQERKLLSLHKKVKITNFPLSMQYWYRPFPVQIRCSKWSSLEALSLLVNRR